MGFLNNEMISKEVQKFTVDWYNRFSILCAEKEGMKTAATALTPERITFNHVSGDLRVKSYFTRHCDAQDKFEWSLYTTLFLLTSSEPDMIKRVALVDDLGIELKAVCEDMPKGIAAQEYVRQLYRIGIQRAKVGYQREEYSFVEESKFYKLLESKSSIYKDLPAHDFRHIGRAIDTEDVIPFRKAYNQACTFVPSKVVEYLEMFLFD